MVSERVTIEKYEVYIRVIAAISNLMATRHVTVDTSMILVTLRGGVGRRVMGHHRQLIAWSAHGQSLAV